MPRKKKEPESKQPEKKKKSDTTKKPGESKRSPVKAPVKAKEKEPIKKKRAKKRIKKEPVIEVHPLEKFGSVCKEFILENIRTVEYRDMAGLIGIKPDQLKEAVESMGIKLPIDRARKWSEIDVGKFRSLSDCARCQIQLKHDTFFVGINKCRRCYEKNIKLWIEKNVSIKLTFHNE